MPTNLPPDYFQVEKRLREAATPAEKIILLEELISTVPKHKGTDHLRAELRRQLSRLKDEAQSPRKHGHQTIYQVEREGAGQVVLIGPANVGKSALVALLTHAKPEVSETPYTTRKPIPGMMPVRDIQIQLVDMPSMDPDYVEAGTFDLIRRSDLLWIVVDILDDPFQQLEDSMGLLKANRITPRLFAEEYETETHMDFLPAVLLANKCDDDSQDELFDIFCQLLDVRWNPLPVSALRGRNYPALKEITFDLLDIIRVYAKPPGKDADLRKPFVLKKGSTVIELAAKIHRDFYDHLKFARVWGSATFDGQQVHRDYILEDGDIVEFHI